MKSLVDLSVLILQDCGIKCGANPIRDIKTVARRTENEGDSFLTITLPSFCQGFERALDRGCISPALFPSFKKRRGTRLPTFLQGFVEMVFSPDGSLRPDASIDAVSAIRQICLFAKKVLIPCTLARERKAEKAFRVCENELKNHAFNAAEASVFVQVSRIVCGDLFAGVPFGNPYDEYHPRHGPGTTREGLRGNRKYRFPNWPQRLESEFPYTEFGIGSLNNFEGPETSDCPGFGLAPRDEAPVKVCFVPKTLKAPRVIAIEPVCMQYMQQAIADWIRPRIESRSRYTAGRVNFTNQQVNSDLALSSSLDGRYATIDMSEASDRVSCFHVEMMFRDQPQFLRQVFATRSTRATLPSGVTIPLRKFASMGSALCFPMEALVFFLAIVSSRLRRSGRRITPSSVKRFTEGVYVYGDDIIVPADEAPTICADLESFGFKVNAHKSFWSGSFRESCGQDAFKGESVTPTYLRRVLPADRTDPNGLVSAVAFANQLYHAGLWKTARYVRECVERILGPLPSIADSSPGLGWFSYSQAESFSGWDSDLQRLKDRRYIPTPVRLDDRLDGDPALLKCFLLIGSNTVDREHLLRSVRYGALALKRRWTPS